jgi:hypothetical protein
MMHKIALFENTSGDNLNTAARAVTSTLVCSFAHRRLA